MEDDTESYTLGDIGAGDYEVFVRHPGKEAVPMGLVKLSACYPTSIEPEVIQEPGMVRVYPNPARSYLTIEGVEGSFQVDVFDVLGKRQRSLSLEGNKERLDLSGLPVGLYMVILDNGVQVMNKKIQVIR